MGNRAVVTFDSFDMDDFGVYLHWNGGRDSVEGLLEATKRVMAGRMGDRQYAMARFVQCATTLFPGNLSIGLDKCRNLDCEGDNGVYVVDSKTLEIKGRWNFEDGVEQYNYDRDEFADEIVAAIEASNKVIMSGE
jgi:hypothetical protein